jgi:farnesyl diphosphate synthase
MAPLMARGIRVKELAAEQAGKGGTSRPPVDFSGLEAALGETSAAMDKTLDAILPRPRGSHARVQEAMRYAVFAGGKRLRPFLVLGSARLFDVPRERALRAAAAIEALHTYSLVHDDLPCMDDDDLRRGKPTTHVKFDEATAVLAGDGLLTLAFEILVQPETHPSAEVRCRLAAGLAAAAGSDGMVGGQMIDMLAPKETFGTEDVVNLQRLKTGALFEFACQAGPVLAEAGRGAEATLRDYARDFGLAFQITDDLIDSLGSAQAAGKSVGKDSNQGKATLVSILGHEGARAKAEALARQAADRLDGFGPEADLLRALPHSLIGRDR